MSRSILLLCGIILLFRCSTGEDLLGGLISNVPESLQGLQDLPTLKSHVEQLEKNLSSLWSSVSNLRQNVEYDLHQLHQFQLEMIDKLKTLFGIEIEHQPKNMYHMQKEGQKHDDTDSHSRTFHGSHDHDHHHDDYHHGDHHDDHHGDHHDDYHHGGHHDDHHGDHHDDYHHGGHHDDYHHDHHFDDSHHHGDDHFRSDDHSHTPEDHHHSHEEHDDDHSHQNTSSHQHETHSDDHHEHDNSHQGSHEDSHEHKDHSDHQDEHDDHTKPSHSHHDDHSQHTEDSHNITHSSHDEHHHQESNQTHSHYNHHHHHHHHKGHSLNSKFDFAICNVMPNRAIPEEKQQNVTGRIRLWQRKNSSSLHIHIHVEGFKMDTHQQHDSNDDSPNKHSHGFHVHRDGDLSNGCQSTGPHFNPLEVAHGGPKSVVRHVGDLGNIECDEHGVTNVVIIDEITSLRGPHSIIGKSLVIHSTFDDFGTNPDIPASISSGNAGARIACCIIEKVDRLPPPVRKTNKNISHHHHSSHH